MTGNYKSLLPLYRQNLRLARQSGDPVAIAGSLADLAHAYEATSQYIQAEAFYRRSLEHYRAAHHLYGEADILIGIGRLQTKLGSYFEAITSLESANALQQQLGEIEGVAIVQYELARTYLRLNRLEPTFQTVGALLAGALVATSTPACAHLVDSLPVMLAQHGHSYRARVGREVADIFPPIHRTPQARFSPAG